MFFGCEEVIEIEVPSSEPKLIIDAIFEVYHNQTPVTANTVVKLRESTDYYDEEIPVITNAATVLLKDLTNDIDIIFEDNNSDGNFVPITQFIPIENVDYELNVFYNEDLYQSQSKLVTTTEFSDVYQGNNTLFTGEEVEVNVSFIDDINIQLNDIYYNCYKRVNNIFYNKNLTDIIGTKLYNRDAITSLATSNEPAIIITSVDAPAKSFDKPLTE